jgi:peptidoglycan/LPS O-acetylase OafA/YrhL
MLGALAVYMALFHRRPQGETRGDFLGGIFYVSNWYQIVVGQGYTAAEAFAPLRHLWSLAVEEQFYLLWPLVMVAILRRGRARLPRVGLWLLGVSVTIAVLTAAWYVGGDISVECSAEVPRGYWDLAGRCMSVNETLYLGTFTRAGGLMLGSAFAMVWRPIAIMRGPLRAKGRPLDVLAGAGIALLAALMWGLSLTEPGEEFGIRFDPWLFRGGFFLTGVATVLVIAAATHQGAATGSLLGNPVLRWIGTRSYGLYLYHWPVYQIIREMAGEALSIGQFVLAMVITVPITEVSYRYIETPIRKGAIGKVLHDTEDAPVRGRAGRRNLGIVVGSAGLLVGTATISFALADNLCVGDVACSIAAQEDAATSTTAAPTTTEAVLPGTPTSAAATTTTIDPATLPPMAFGESVMLGAVNQLQRGGFEVDAAENRQGTDLATLFADRRAAGTISSVVVIQIGTNGTVSDETLAAIMTSLPPELTPTVVFLTVRAPDVAWIDDNNDKIRALPATYPNVTIADWATVAETVELCKDGTHIACNGTEPAQTYANMIFDAIGRPELKPVTTLPEAPAGT